MILNFDDLPKFEHMIDALHQLEASTHYVEADLSNLKYERDTEWGTVNDGLSGRRELTEWSCRQLCRLAKIPFTFFKKSTPQLAKETFEEWVPAMNDPLVKLAIRSYGGSKEVIRGILPVDYPEVRNSEVLEAVGNVGVPFSVESAPWMDSIDPPFIKTRFILNDMEYEIGSDDKLYVGVDVLCSELNASVFEINLLLFRLVCRNGAIAVFDNKPYFYFDYKTSFMFDLGDLICSSVDRLNMEKDNFFDVAKKSLDVKITSDQAKVVIMEMVKGESINKGVAVRTIKEIDRTGAATGWDLVNALTSSAQGFRDVLRLRYETAAGALMGLSFSRNKKEDDYAMAAPEKMLPPAFRHTSNRSRE